MKVRVFNGDEDFETGGFRAVKKLNHELSKRPHRGTEDKRRDDSRRKVDRCPRGLDVRGQW